jgi:hypothetical protein
MTGRDAQTGTVNDLEHTMKEELLISELQLVYAEKRTSLSILRTGIAVLTIPLSFFTVLVATSRYYDISDPSALIFAVPFMVLCLALITFGSFLILRSFKRIKRCDTKIAEIRSGDRLLRDLAAD